MDISLLKKLDLSDKEIKVYLTLLEYSPLSVRGLADIANLNRGTVYDILKKLQEQGLVTYYHTNSKQKFVAENPEKLSSLLEAKEAEVKQLGTGLKELVPMLMSLQDKGDDRPASKYYEGRSGVRGILEDVLSSMKDSKEGKYYVYSAKNSSEDLNKAFPEFTKKRIKADIKVQVISLAKGGKLSGLDERRWMGTDDDSATFIILYAGKCAYIDRDLRGQPIGVVIENNSIYQTNKLIFSQLWKKLR